jgi:hypothetical protein
MKGDEIEKLKQALTATTTSRLVPFGKYRGQPIEVMRQDSGYMDWLAGQEGIRRQYPWIFSVVVNVGGEASETPEHNRYQALFLDQDFAAAVFDSVFPDHRNKHVRDDRAYKFEPVINDLNSKIRSLQGKIENTWEMNQLMERPYYPFDPKRISAQEAATQKEKNQLALVVLQQQQSDNVKSLAELKLKLAEQKQQCQDEVAREIFLDDLLSVKVEFETSVWMDDGYRGRQSGFADVALTCSRCRVGFRIEIKPSMGDEYPAVLRQMKASACDVLYLVNYTGEGATLAQVRAMFAASGVLVLQHARVAGLAETYRVQE